MSYKPIGGQNSQVQYNNSGSFGASSTLSWDKNASVFAVDKKVRVNTGNGVLSMSDLTGSAFTDSGYQLEGGNGLTSALFTEVNGSILSLGINVSQITPSVAGNSGWIFRLDNRSTGTVGDYNCFVVKTVPSGGAETNRFIVQGEGSVLANGPILPLTNDVAALGSNSNRWSDLFLASGGVINWPQATLTEGASVLTSNVDIQVPDEAYGVGWNGSTEVPTKNAVYDKIETLGGGGMTLAGMSSVLTSVASVTEADLISIPVNIPTTSPVKIAVQWKQNSGAVEQIQLGLKLNATTVRDATTVTGGATNAEIQGMSVFEIPPRYASYLKAGTMTNQSNDGTYTLAQALSGFNADAPNTTISSVLIRGKTANGNNLGVIRSVFIWTYPTS